MNYKFTVLLFTLCFTTLGFAQTLKPKTYTQWITKSADYIEQNKLDSAEYALNQALISDPDNKNNSWLMTSLSTIQQHQGKFDAAYMSISAALNKHPNAVFLLHQRATLLKEMQKWEEAKQDYSTILSIDSLDVDALFNRGVLKLKAKDRAGAEKDFEVAEQHGEFSPYSLLGKALIYRLDENWEGAEKIYTSVLSSYPAMKDLYLKRAECYLNLNETSKLAADLQAAAPTEFDNPTYYFMRGQMRLKQFDKTAALNDFQKAKDLGMDSELLKPWIKKTN
ncbi:MAG: tetratricopeptide repeat protein [Candidatus Saccharimonadaceae bacterium]